MTPPAAADELRLDARGIVGRAVTRDVQLAADGKSVELCEGELIEDDGPAAGFSYKPNEERITDRVWAKKDLVISDPRARKATLLIGPGGGPKVRINGNAIEIQPAKKVGGYWEAHAIPPDVLKPGTNEVVLHGAGRVWIARAENFAAGSADRPKHPNRSAKSSDGGATWNSDRLGRTDDTDGEYYVRLFLDRYRSAGSLELQVFDSGNLAERVVAPPLALPGSIRVNYEVNAGGAGRVVARARTGPTPTPDAEGWSEWEVLGLDGAIRNTKGRYFQIALDLTTTNPLQTPRINHLTITTDPRKGDDWAAHSKATEIHNADIVRSSVPFAYEPYDHPRLKELREKYELDAVATGAKTELELVERLAAWSARRWDRGHLKDIYPPWNALEILKPHADGTPVGGFCQQYNLVFLQACESFGIPGRAVSVGVGDHGDRIRGGGHEVVELWLNQFQKWVYIDGNMAWYAVDAASGVPLSLWELRQRQLLALDKKDCPAVRVVHLSEAPKRWTGLTDWPPFLELRMIPRSNFLEQSAPLPLNQGMRGWFWTGHHVWTDADNPASLMYGNRVVNRRNWEWTLNQTRFTLEATNTPGEVRVHLATVTPGFDRFLAAVDGRQSQPVKSGFVWKLNRGTNKLEVRSQNRAGREGSNSYAILDYL